MSRREDRRSTRVRELNTTSWNSTRGQIESDNSCVQGRTGQDEGETEARVL